MDGFSIKTLRMIINGTYYAMKDVLWIELNVTLKPSFMEEHSDGKGRIVIGDFVTDKTGYLIKTIEPVDQVINKLEKWKQIKRNNEILVFLYEEMKKAIQPEIQKVQQDCKI